MSDTSESVQYDPSSYAFVRALEASLPGFYVIVNREAGLSPLHLSKRVALQSAVALSRGAKAVAAVNRIGLQGETWPLVRAQTERIVTLFYILYAGPQIDSVPADTLAERYLDYEKFVFFKMHELYPGLSRRISIPVHDSEEIYDAFLSALATDAQRVEAKWGFTIRKSWIPHSHEVMLGKVRRALPDFVFTPDEFDPDTYMCYRLASQHVHATAAADRTLTSQLELTGKIVDKSDHSSIYADWSAKYAYYGWMALARCLGSGPESLVSALFEQELKKAEG